MLVVCGGGGQGRGDTSLLFLGKGFCVKTSCLPQSTTSCIVSSLTVRANVHEACWSTFELLLHNWGEKNKERNVDFPRQLGGSCQRGKHACSMLTGRAANPDISCEALFLRFAVRTSQEQGRQLPRGSR